MPQKALKLSQKVDECKPLADGAAVPSTGERHAGEIVALMCKAGAYTRPLFQLNLSRFQHEHTP
jgi:hypothetical protein